MLYLMASKLSFLNSLTERNKPKESTDELALVKAAAWAWYQHGSTSSEFDSSRTTRHQSRPSRYKLEAVRMANKEAKKGSIIPSKEKSLLDAYEVQSITRRLNSLIIESSHNNKHVNSASSNNSSVDIGGRKMEKKKMRRGFWKHGAVCGREEDVVDPIALRDGHQYRQSVKLVKLPTPRGAL